MRICIDAGHGFGNRTAGVFDPGACAAKVREADVALAYALSLKAALGVLGVAVFMTRESNAKPCPVGQRARNAAQAGCTAFVSLHLNAYNGAATGVEVLYRDERKDLPLARALQAALVRVTGLPDRKTKQRLDLSVLKFAAGPAVLLELGFIDNPRDRSLLLNASVRDAVCAALAQTLLDQLGAKRQAPPAPAMPKPANVLEISGPWSTFGGPGDGPEAGNNRPDWREEGLAILVPADVLDPRLGKLFLPQQPRGTTGLARRLDPEADYVACPWPYIDLPPAQRKAWKRHLRNTYATVLNPRTGAKCETVVGCDWGPSPDTGRKVDLSPGLARRLGLKKDDRPVVLISLPPQA